MPNPILPDGLADNGSSREFDGVVAIVDDDLSVRRALRRLFHTIGIRSVTHDSGREFLESARLHDVDCLLLDVHMPGMSGMDVLGEVRVAASKLPVILMTARYELDFAEKALAAGASAYLSKPFAEEELFAAVSEATGRPIGT